MKNLYCGLPRLRPFHIRRHVKGVMATAGLNPWTNQWEDCHRDFFDYVNMIILYGAEWYLGGINHVYPDIL